MPESVVSPPKFNLWHEPWITLERFTGGVERQGIAHALLYAHEYKGIYEPSPLAVVGIHRLLTAILQVAINPQKNSDLKKLWQAERLPADSIKSFREQYACRFDLFSSEAPFLQSADLPLQPEKGEKTKTIAYLAAEMPCGTGITHYRHGDEEEQCFCPECAATGLVMIPAFATSGGAGIKPSINGVPPIYVIPGGQSLFESLRASLLTPAYQPAMRSLEKDDAWWLRQPLVGKSHEVFDVGYLHSLTFPARRVRLHPTPMIGHCTRCGRASPWGIRTMIFEMGESRSKEAEFWLDPFAAYKKSKDEEKDRPTPIRPTEGRVLWRDFSALFLHHPAVQGSAPFIRPGVLAQIAAITSDLNLQAAYPFRCVGVRTDMKAKVFEWIDAGFDVPPVLLTDEDAGPIVQTAVDFAASTAKVISDSFRNSLKGRKDSKSQHHEGMRQRMITGYWASLADPFRQFVLQIAAPDRRVVVQQNWEKAVIRQGRDSFATAFDNLGDDAKTLRQRVLGEKLCNIGLYKLTQKGKTA